MSAEPDVTVVMKDIRIAKMCARGARDFWRDHNLDWDDFLDNGIPASVLLATGDENAAIVVEVARGRK